ncbi:hypothetical protein HpDR72_30000 [Helicobacter pylori]
MVDDAFDLMMRFYFALFVLFNDAFLFKFNDMSLFNDVFYLKACVSSPHSK